MGASIQSGQIDQSGQTDQSGQIDLSVSNIDMNDNIQINYPDTSNSNQWNDTGIFDNSGNDRESFETGNGNDETGNGNDENGNDKTGNGNYEEVSGDDQEVRVIGQVLVNQQLALSGINTFALTYSDGSAHFQGSTPGATYDLSAPEDPIDGADTTDDSQGGAYGNPEIDFPFYFDKNEFE